MDHAPRTDLPRQVESRAMKPLKERRGYPGDWEDDWKDDGSFDPSNVTRRLLLAVEWVERTDTTLIWDLAVA